MPRGAQAAAGGGLIIKSRMKKIARNVHREVAERLDQNAEDLLMRARGLAPQLESHLIGSGDFLRRGNKTTHKRIVFFDIDYAVVRHEEFYNLGPVSSMKRSPDGTIGRKFLERPFKAQFAKYRDNIAEGIQLALRQSVR